MKKPRIVKEAEVLAETYGLPAEDQREAEALGASSEWTLRVWWQEEREVLWDTASAVEYVKAHRKKLRPPKVDGVSVFAYSQAWRVWFGTWSSPDPSNEGSDSASSDSASLGNLRGSGLLVPAKEWMHVVRGQGNPPRIPERLNDFALNLLSEMQSGDWHRRRLEHVRRASVLLPLAAGRAYPRVRQEASAAGEPAPRPKPWFRPVRQMLYGYQMEIERLTSHLDSV